jgi:hypothetical protein
LAAELHRRVVELRDYEYFWDAFMFDELAKQWVEDPATHEALTWLKSSPTAEGRTLDMLKTADDSVKMIESLYEAGAMEVRVIEIDDYGGNGDLAAGSLLIKLPGDAATRRTVLAWVDRHDDDRETPRADHGQAYVHFYP